MSAVHRVIAHVASFGPAFLDHLLQATAFAVLLALVYRCARRTAPSLRHSMMLAALLRFLVPTPWLSTVVEQWSLPHLPIVTPVELLSPVISLPMMRSAPVVHEEWWCILALSWASVAASLLLAQTIRALKVWRLVKQATPLSNTLLPACESHAVSRPALFGFWRPMVLLPFGMTCALTESEFEAVMMHEAEHCKRRDNWTTLIQALVGCVFWFHPLVWWISRRLVDNRELACDGAVLAAGIHPRTYVTAISKICRLGLDTPIGGVPATGGSNLQQRLEAIMSGKIDMRTPMSQRLMGRACVAAAFVAGVTGAFLNAQSPRPERAAFLAPQQPAVQSSTETPYHRWVNSDVVYIITDVERARFQQLTTDEERERFIEQFWQRRDPNPGTERNKAKEEHYRRIAYSNQRFGGKLPGWQTPRGRFYIVFGPPDEIESHPREGYEMWRYNSGMLVGADLRFRID